MPRPPTSRPPGEHLAILARILRQVDLGPYDRERKQRIIAGITSAMTELSKEIATKSDCRQGRIKTGGVFW